jgi:hemerythrin-like domain-containing protein
MSSSVFSSTRLPMSGQFQPLDLVYSCHRRVLRSCATLKRLVFYMADCGFSRDAQVVSHGVLRLFDNDVTQLYADEEEDLFPALIESMAGSDAVCLHDLTGHSTRQHRALASQWDALRAPLEEIAAGRNVLLPARKVETFSRQWYDHIELEESELLPMALRLLSDDELARVHRGMQQRRDWPQ